MKKVIFPLIVFYLITMVFFYKIFIFGLVPFPGDLLVSEYAPWKFEKYLGYNPSSYPNKAQYFDVIRQLYPWKILAIDELKQGRLPLWNPYNFSGSPLLANNQTGVFNLFNYLFFIFEPTIAWSIYIATQPLAAGYFMYLYIRKLKLSLWPAFFGGISYGFCLYMSTFLQYGNFGHTIMWLPYALLLVENIRDNTKKKSLFIFPLIVAFIIFAGHLQLAFGVLLFLFAYIIINHVKRLRLLVLLFLGIGIASVQLFPTLELILQSARTTHDLSTVTQNFLLQFQQLILFISPDAYGNPATRNYLLTDTYPGNAIFLGVAPFLFSILAAFSFKKNYYIKLFSISVAVLLVFLTNNPISYVFYSLKLPLISTSASSNFIFLLVFSLSVLAAFGLDYWFTNKQIKTIPIVSIVVIGFCILVIAHQILGIDFLLKQTLLGGGVLVLVSVLLVCGRFVDKKIIIFIILFITVGELFYYFQKFNPFVPSELVYPPTKVDEYLKKNAGLERYWGVGNANIEANFSTEFRAFSPEGYDPLYPKWYGDFIYKNEPESKRSDATIKQPDLKNSIYNQNSLEEKLSQLSVKYVLDREENGATGATFADDKFTFLTKVDGWKIMQNNTSLPRAFTIFSDCKNLIQENCFLRENIEKAEITQYTPMSVSISTGSRSGVLVVTDTYYPGWNVTVNGSKKQILKLPNGLRGVENVGPNSQVVMQYGPFSFHLGVIITIISCIGSIVLVKFKFNE